jgi:hypothetical protein
MGLSKTIIRLDVSVYFFKESSHSPIFEEPKKVIHDCGDIKWIENYFMLQQ